jgi:hypothetical protein
MFFDYRIRENVRLLLFADLISGYSATARLMRLDSAPSKQPKRLHSVGGALGKSRLCRSPSGVRAALDLQSGLMPRGFPHRSHPCGVVVRESAKRRSTRAGRHTYVIRTADDAAAAAAAARVG